MQSFWYIHDSKSYPARQNALGELNLNIIPLKRLKSLMADITYYAKNCNEVANTLSNISLSEAVDLRKL